MTGPPDIQDAPDLLAAMTADSAKASDFWRPTAYWRGYSDRIGRELGRSRLQSLRTNQRLLKGYASGGPLVAPEPLAGWKRTIWRSLSAAPLFRRILAEHRRVGAVMHSHTLRYLKGYSKHVLDEIAGKFPDLTIPGNMAAAGAEDCFEWRGQHVGAYWILFLARAADFYAVVPPAKICAILEIGPGLGLGTLAHIALNPNLRTVYNVDISPVAYISTQFLRTCPDITVVDYLETRGAEALPPAPGQGPTVYQILPWQVPLIPDAAADFAFNAFSFQEMEKDICQNYAREVARIATDGVMLHSRPKGHAAGAGGQAEPITMAFLKSLFEDRFPDIREVDGFWPAFFADHGAAPEQTALLRLAGADGSG